MDNLKYYNDSFAYDYDRFVSVPKKKAEIHEYPIVKTKAKSKADRRKAQLVRNFVISGLAIMAVCSSLFLRAEISSMRSDINDINNEIVELESEKTRLSVEMERKVSVINLEESAIALGMQKCEKSQVTYINTNNTDTAVNSKGELTVRQNID